MKKIKSKIFTLMITLALACSCFLFAPKQMDVYAQTIEEGSCNAFVTNDNFAVTTNQYTNSNKELRVNLFGSTSEDITSHYNIYAKAGTPLTYSKDFSGSRLYYHWNGKGTIKFTTQFEIANPQLASAINNRAVSIQLSADLSAKDSGYAKIINNSTEKSFSSSASITDAITLTSTVSDIEFYASGTWGTTLEVKNPVVVLTTSDTSAPVVTLQDISGWEWQNSQFRQVSFDVQDSQSGISSVRVINQNGEDVTASVTSSSADSKSKTYVFDAYLGENYRVVTTDNVNNTATYDLISSDQLKLDTTSGILNINQIDTLHSNKLNVKFNYTSDSKSDETLYYTLVSVADYDDATNTPSQTRFDGKLDVSLLDDEVAIPFGTIISSPTDNTNYILSAVVIDSVGNVSGLSKQTFKYDSRRYAVVVELDGGTLDNLNGCETLGELFETVPHAWSGTLVDFGYKANDGYEFYELVRYEIAKNDDGTLAMDENGNYLKIGQGQVLTGSTISSGYKYSCEDNYIYLVKFRYIVKLTPVTTQLEYLADDSGEGVIQNFEFSLNDTYGESAIDKKLIEITYTLNGNIVDEIKDAGVYLVNWRVKDSVDFVGAGSLNITVNPKAVTLIYDNIEDLVYNQSTQTILVECDKTNLNDAETLLLGLNILYFDASDLEYANPLLGMTNAGSYMARVTLANSNYILQNPLQAVVVAKKTVAVDSIVKSTFAYNASKQMIEYVLSENIETTVNYFVLNGEDKISVGDNFLNAGQYWFEILPVDSINYILSNNTGDAEITIVDAYFRLNKSTYDYTGIALTIDNLDYTISDSEADDAQSIMVNGLNFEAYDADGNLTDACEPDRVYKIIFKTNDTNYNLYNFEYSIEIKTTVLNIVVKDIYEFTGSDIEFEYVIQNEMGEPLSEISGIDVQIKLGDDTITAVKNVAKYTYTFVASDPRFVLIGATGEFEVITANLTIQVNSLTYSYNKDGYNIDYVVTSALGADYKDKVKFVILQDGTECNLSNAGEYDFEIEFVDDSFANGMLIEKICNLQGEQVTAQTITIIPAEVWLDVVRVYSYTGEEISVEYASQDILEASEISISHDTILNVGDYICTILSLNPNYVIRVEDCETSDNVTTCQIRVNPCIVYVKGEIYRYTYTGQEIDLVMNLTKENLDYTVVSKLNGEEIHIINAGTYSVTLKSSDPNYEIDRTIEIVVEPKELNIVLDKNSIIKTYNKDIKSIEYSVLDGENLIDVATIVTYYGMDGAEVSPVNAGSYSWQIEVLDNNYVASLASDSDTNLMIAKKQVLLSVKANQFKSYGSADSVIEYTLTGVCEGDSLDINLQREQGESVGRYQINLIDFQSENYEIEYTFDYFRITPKKLLVIANKITKTFGDFDPELTYKMYMDGKLANSLLGEDILEGSLERVQGENVGTYLITLGTLYNSNYNIVFSEDILTILPKDLNVILQDKTVVYGGSEKLTYIADEDYDPQFITGEPTRQEGSSVGEYIISGGTLTSTNYKLNITNGKYTITKAPLVIKAYASTKVYGEQDSLQYSVEGLKGDDILEGKLSREQGEDVGTYAITLGSIQNPNYEIEFVPNTLTIVKANLEIVIDDKTQVYGEEQVLLTYTIVGLQYDDEIAINLMKTGSDNAGIYKIVGDFEIPNNYALTKYETGTYTIEKATVVPVLSPKTFIYSGKEYAMTCDNLDLPLRFVYKQFGMVVDSVINAGTYKVQAYFDGNENYNSSASAETDLVIEQQLVFFTLTQTEFIYDGSVKYPVYTFDKTIGLTEHQIEFTFQEGLEPIEVGEYNFEMKVKDGLNFKGTTQGTIKIQNAFVVKDNNGIIECNDATFDENVQKIKLVQKTDTKKFNNEKVLSVYTLENADEVLDSGYVYTVKVKATQGVDSVKVYKVGLSGFSEIAIKVENGYYVFQVDDLNNKYIITTEQKTLSTLAWILILVAVALAFSITLIVVAKKKHKKAKVSQVSDKDIETYNAN